MILSDALILPDVRVLTMLAASIDGFLLFWQPATS